MLADAAFVSEGKFFIHGGGWDRIFAEQAPASHASLAFVFLLRVEWSETNEQHPLVLELLDEDDNPLIHAEGQLEVGRPPGTRKGDPIWVPQQWTLQGTTFPKFGTYRFRITSGDNELASTPLHLTKAKPGTFGPT